MRRNLTLKTLLSVKNLAACVLFSLSVPASAAPPVQVQLKNTVLEWRNKMGALESWQNRVFDEEVAQDYSLFIKHYRANGSQVSAEVDGPSLRKYLAFYGPRVGRPGQNKILTIFKFDPTCQKCETAAPALKKNLTARLQRRGLIPLWVTDSQAIPSQGASSVAAEMAREKGALGHLILQVRPEADSDESPDAATNHAAEEHYRLALQVQLGSSLKTEQTLELLKNDPMETALQRLMVGAMTELGSQMGSVEAASQYAANQANDEIEVTLTGVRSFSDMIRIKTALQEALRSDGIVSPRTISRDEVSLSVRTKKNPDEIKRAIRSMVLEGRRLSVSDSAQGLVRVEVQ